MNRGVAAASLFLISLTVFVGYARAQEPDQAGLVVSFGDGRTETFCIELDEPEISGYELLTRTELDIEVSSAGMGTALCRVEDTGCPTGSCFCKCRGADCEYWSYWHLGDDGWEYSAVGATLHRVEAGSVDGWTWGPGSVTEAVEPPAWTLEEICAVSEQPETVAVTGTDVALEDQGAAAGSEPSAAETGAAAASRYFYPALAGLVVVGLLIWLLVSRGRTDGT